MLITVSRALRTGPLIVGLSLVLPAIGFAQQHAPNPYILQTGPDVIPFGPLPLMEPVALPNQGFVQNDAEQTVLPSQGFVQNSSIREQPALPNPRFVQNSSEQTALQNPNVIQHSFIPEQTSSFIGPQDLPVVSSGMSYFEVTQPNESTPMVLQASLSLPTVPPIFSPSAVQTGEAPGLIGSYESRAFLSTGQDSIQPTMPQLPAEFQPWWSNATLSPLGMKSQPLTVSLDVLIQRALASSPHIQVAATAPHIRRAALLEESSQFDWVSFVEARYDDQNDPIGNTLTTGDNSDRFTQQEWSSRSGLRRRNTEGGEFEISQRTGTLDNNSSFLVPQNQGNSRIELNYRQPILRGRGRAVNESLIVLADIDFRSASDELLSEIQSHLVDLTESYWELVRARSELLQRSKLLNDAETILNRLEGRKEVDTLDRQVFRARAAVAKRKAEIARSVTSVKNAESRIRLLVNDSEIINASGIELVPSELPTLQYMPIELSDAISTALSNRPDISQAIRRVKATSIQLGVSRNELLPKLDFLLGTYVAGLDGDNDIVNAWVSQFRDGRPGFNLGFDFEIPIGNRAALARQERRQWEANRSLHQFRAVVETGLTDVEVAVREVETAHLEMLGRYHAMVASENETSFLLDRWQTLPNIDDSATLLLEDLLDSQERRADEEAAFSKAQFDYAVAVVRLKQSVGTLFRVN